MPRRLPDYPPDLTPTRTYRSVSGQGIVECHRDDAGNEYVRCQFTVPLDQPASEVLSMFPLNWEPVKRTVQRIVDGQVVIEVTRIDGRVFGVIVETDDSGPFEATP